METRPPSKGDTSRFDSGLALTLRLRILSLNDKSKQLIYFSSLFLFSNQI